MRRHVVAALCSGMVAACGGGGGDGPAPVQPTVAITAANQDQVARTSASAVVSVATAGAGGIASSGGAGVAALPSISRRVALALSTGRKTVLAAGTAQPLASASETVACAYAGTITVTANDNNNNGNPDAGDSIAFTFSNCQTTANDSANGSLAVTLASVTANGYSGTMTLDLVSTEGLRSGRIAGSVTAIYTELSTTQSRTEVLVGANGLAGTVSLGNVSETITYENAFSISTTDTVNGTTPVSSSTTVSGAISASGLANGRIVLATPTPIFQLATDAYPSSGALRATGTSGSTLLITAVDAQNVQLQLDADGNGSYDLTSNRTWGQVLPNN